MDLANLPVIVASLVGFLILMAVLKKPLWTAVPQVIDSRRKSIEDAFDEIDRARTELAKQQAEYEKRMADINAEAQAKMQEALDKGQAAAAEIKAHAEEAREKLLARTQEDIQREKEKALAELNNAAIDLSFRIAQRVMKEDLDKDRHDRLVSSFISDMRELN
ncbi:F0F1 ATP synthase subunit B [bacterium]|nr:F0F1 ATP synthase subunit B [bacterium]MCB1221676.1 F0F1 ATP synthase subunit B [bacterium]UNM08981.1 MAG: F0F1 ATP synthase subunit B [Planctomycetales bacterium]